MYVFFLGENSACNINTVFITVNMILNIVVTLFSIYPPLQEKNPRIGLLQSAVVSIYTTYLTYSALARYEHHINCMQLKER